MIDAKEAHLKAREHLMAFFPEAENVQLEEVERSANKAQWLITLSYEGVSNSVASSLLVGKGVLYKIFTLDAKTGEVLSMKTRIIK